MQLPRFTYVPDPLRAGMIEESEATCECCNQARGFICNGGIYARDNPEYLCPWCVADGSAAAKFDGDFTWVERRPGCEVPAEVEEIIQHRTPGFNSIQEQAWLACCNDACEFHGLLSREEFVGATGVHRDALMQQLFLTDEQLAAWRKHYRPGGDPGFFKFTCRHCGHWRLIFDGS